jgi:hypothetical protein
LDVFETATLTVLRRYGRMKRTISSKLTFLFKFILPIPWILWIIIALPKTISRLSALGGVSIKSWIMLCIWICGSAVIFWFCKTLKKVVIDYSGKLLISNYLKVIEVKPEEITHIYDGTDFFHQIGFALRKPSAFGRKIIFMPRWYPGYYGSKSLMHPIVEELQNLVSLSKGKRRGK